MSETAKMWGEGIFLGSLSASLGSCVMSSVFSVINFSKDQKILQRAADALRQYVIIAIIWCVASMLQLGAMYGLSGTIVGLLTNLVIILWLVVSYLSAFKQAATEQNLEFPTVFSPSDWKFFIGSCIITVLFIAYMHGCSKHK